jgi:hypothetical protein
MKTWRLKAAMVGMLVGISCIIAAKSFAFDLEVYGGSFIDAPKNYGLSSAENPKYLAGIRVEESFLWRKLTPYFAIETLMDARVKGSVGAYDGYSPSSVKYTAGAELDLYAGIGLRAEHMCHHNISRQLYGGDTAQYTNVQVFYRFRDVLKK